MDQRQLQIVLKLQDQATAELRKLSKEFDSAEKSTSGWGATLATIGRAAAATAAAIGSVAIAAGTWGFKVAAQLQTAQVGLETLLGSAEAAAKTVDRLKKEAARTPFELPGLTQAVQLLTSVTKDGDKSIDIILDIGEGLAAMGKGQAELDRIIVNLQQIAATGKAATIDIKQFAFAGIPIYEMLAQTTGKSGEALQQLIEDGGVTFDVLTKMFDQANDAGGRFFNAYQNQSGTFNQATSNMKDSIGIFLSDVVTQSGAFDALTNAMMAASNWLLNYKQNIENAKQTVADWIEQLDTNTGIITFMKDAWNQVVEMFNTQLRPALAQLWETLQPYKPYLEALATVVGTVLYIAFLAAVKAIQILMNILILLLTWWTKIYDFIMGMFIVALNKTTDVIQVVIEWVDKLIDKFKSAWEWAGKLGDKAGAFIGDSFVGKAWDKLTGKATGGPVSGGTPYIVGEAGPELFVPSSSGTIIPNGGMGGSVNITINGDVSGRELVEKVQEGIMASLRNNMKLA